MSLIVKTIHISLNNLVAFSNISFANSMETSLIDRSCLNLLESCITSLLEYDEIENTTLKLLQRQKMLVD